MAKPVMLDGYKQKGFIMKRNIAEIYSLRNTFSIIGLTGRKGAGVSYISQVLSTEFYENDFPKSKTKNMNTKERQHKIIYDYSIINWRKYKIIKYKKVLFYCLMKYSFNEFKEYVVQKEYGFRDDLKQISTILIKYKNISKKINDLGEINERFKNKTDLTKLYSIFFGKEFNNFVEEMDNVLSKKHPIDRTKFLQQISNNLRQSGLAYKETLESESNIYTIAQIINRIIKSITVKNERAHIVIDSLRNSLEIMFFKERYSAFYMFAVNSHERRSQIMQRYNSDQNIVEEIMKIDEDEYLGRSRDKDKDIRFGDFYLQDVQNCIQISDVFISNNPSLKSRLTNKINEPDIIEESKKSVKIQLLRYTALILHPGIVTPSHQERCMQIAFISKYNSGCISRKVGAVITDENYSIKSVGWNDVPSGLVSCNLRSTQSLIKKADEQAFSPYEKDENTKKSKFYDTINKFYSDVDFNVCDGLNHSYCFKDFQNYIENEKNQVHTRSLHAEENAMLQIAKYGGQSIKQGKLFTTASPCELCSKKARQLEISEIYYIDPYPGISKRHILEGTINGPKLILFAGAIGRAYSRLYEPFMSHKDELVILTGKTPKKNLITQNSD